MLRDKIASTKREIAQVAVRRSTSRKKRQRVPLPTMAIVGYTNAGKSTLLNCITGASVISEDKLFATLDPTSRKVRGPSGRTIVLTDTVGFIRKLPHRLVDSFKATLEEALVADLLLHVVDLSNPEFDKQMETTREVLRELGAEEKEILTVYNKIDQVENPLVKAKARGLASPCSFISSKSGEGVESLILMAEGMLEDRATTKNYLVPHDQYALITRLREQGALLSEEVEEEGVLVKAAPRGNLAYRMKEFVLPPN
jgi:GTP-binding protein HflX